MAEQEPLYPPMTKSFAERRKALAPKPAEAFKEFSRSVFAEGAIPAKTKQLIAVAVAHAMPILHSQPHQHRAQAWRHGRGDHGSHLGRCRDARRRRLCPFRPGTG